MNMCLVTCVITTSLLLSMVWGKHFIIKTKEATNNDPMNYAKDDDTKAIHGKPFRTYGDYEVGEATKQKEEIKTDHIVGEHLSPDDFIAADFVNKTFDGFLPHPIQRAGIFEGDIILPDVRKVSKGQRNAKRAHTYRWPDAKIPYIITGIYSPDEKAVIARAMKEFHENTCIEFIPWTKEVDNIDIVKPNNPGSCASGVGRKGGKMEVELGISCIRLVTVMHELMHVAGFYHEHSRADREDYITILWDNIRDDPVSQGQYLAYNLTRIDHLGAKYDKCSIMHYGPTFMAKSHDKPAFVEKEKGKCKMGSAKGFSDTDIRKLNTYYQCKGYKQVGSDYVSEPETEKEKPWVKPHCVDTWEGCTITTLDVCRSTPNLNNLLVMCPLTCKECGVTCADSHVKCEIWAKARECSKSAKYMDIYCPMACKRCKAKTCKDETSQCKSWAEKGDCNNPRFADYMRLRCKKSCHKC